MSYNYDTSHDSKNYTPGSQALAVFGRARNVEGITIHWWGDPSQNPSFAGVRDYLCRPNGNTSAHIVATGTGRQVACIVGYNDVAWHTGNAVGNAITIGIECDPRARDEDYDVIAEVIADIRSAFGDVPIYSHNMWSATSCPGVYDIDRLDKLSYTKQSNANWGEVTDKNPKAPQADPTPPVTVPVVDYYRVFAGDNQVGAYTTDANAYQAYITKNANKITHSGRDVTAEIVEAFTTPSPTTKDPETGEPLPDTGVPVTQKDDYSEDTNETVHENNRLLKEILAKWNDFIEWFGKLFKRN